MDIKKVHLIWHDIIDIKNQFDGICVHKFIFKIKCIIVKIFH